MMRAIVVREFGPIGSATVETIPQPVPGEGEVLIKIAYAPVNFVDSLVLRGTYQFLPPRPFVPGKGPTGTVIAVGPGVRQIAVGDRVLAMIEQGGYAEAALATESQCYRLPESMSFESAATVSLAFDTAWFAIVERARLRPGDSVLVLGATGAVGSAAVQLAKAKGARVIAAVSGVAKGPAMLELGAEAFVDVSVADLRDRLRSDVHSLTGGAGVDVVIDPLGGAYFEAALRALAWEGRLVVIGFASGDIPTVKANYLLVKNIEVSGLQISDYRKRRPERVRESFEDIFCLFERGAIKASRIEQYPLERYAEALSDLLERRAMGRVVLKP
jgi:NADPH2:quinone reductase